MKIQFNTDVNIHGTEALAAQVSASIEQALERFERKGPRLQASWTWPSTRSGKTLV